MSRICLARQRYFFTAEIAENAEKGELLWPLLSRSSVVVLPSPCFLPFSAFSAASAVKSRVVGLDGPHGRSCRCHNAPSDQQNRDAAAGSTGGRLRRLVHCTVLVLSAALGCGCLRLTLEGGHVKLAVVPAMDFTGTDDPTARPPLGWETDSPERGIAAALSPCPIPAAYSFAADRPENPARLLRSAKRHALAGEHDAAIGELTRLAEVTPTDAHVYVWRAHCLERTGDLDSAIRDYSKAITLSPNKACYCEGRARVYYAKDDWDRAIADLSRVIELVPRNAAAYILRGESHCGKKDYGRGVEDFTKAIGITPEDPVAYANRAVAYLFMGRFDLCIADATVVIEHTPEFFSYVLRADAFVETRRLDEAIADYTEAIRLRPRDTLGYIRRARAYRRKYCLIDELRDCINVIRLEPESSRAHVLRGRTFRRLGDDKSATADFTKAISLDPQSSSAYSARILSLRALGRHAEAVLDASRLIELSPTSTAYVARARAREAAGDCAEAIEDWTRAIEVGPDRPYMYHARGAARWRLGETQAALADFELWHGKSARGTKAYYYRAFLRHRRRDVDAAIADLTRALSANKDSALLHYSRGLARFDKGDAGGAIADLTRATDMEPANADAYLARAAAHLLAGDGEKAALDCDKVIELAPNDARAYYCRSVAHRDCGDPSMSASDAAKARDLISHRIAVEHRFTRRPLTLTVPVSIGGKQYEFDVDTGASITVVDASLRHHFGAHLFDVEGAAPGGSVTMSIHNPPDARVGRINLKDFGPVACMDMAFVEEFIDRPLHGILGMNVLRHYVTLIDFEESTVTLLKPDSLDHPEFGPSVGMIGRAGGAYEITAKGFGNEVRLLVDTGDHGSGSLPMETFSAAVRDRGVPTAPTLELSLAGCREIASCRVDTFRLGHYTHEGTIMNGSRIPTLGLGVLSDYTVAFDPANSLLHLRRRKGCPRRDELGMSGLVLVRRKGRIVVYHVYRDTPASLAGILTGDVVVTIDGKDAAELRLYELGARLSSCEGGRVSLVMERNGERREVVLVLRRRL